MDASVLIRTARRDAGLALRELARRAGTSHATLIAYEHGTKEPRLSTLERILHAAGVDIEPRMVNRIETVNGLDRGDELMMVLDLASMFPARHSPTLEMPPFPQVR
jgi:transcriptional regulator with XRE-family HTH domain